MTAIAGNPSVDFGARKSVLLTSLVLVFVGAAADKDHRRMKTADKPYVVAHIQFDGMSEVDMTIQSRTNGKYYLFVQYAEGEGVSIIDVSNPEKPKAMGILPPADATDDAKMSITGNMAIVSDHACASSQSNASSNDDLVLWDTSDPTSPRLVQKFSNVVKWLQDDRELIYVLADGGLWTFRKQKISRSLHPIHRPMEGEQIVGVGELVHKAAHEQVTHFDAETHFH